MRTRGRSSDRTVEQAHVAVSAAALRSLFATPIARAHDMRTVAVGGALALLTRVRELDFNRVIGLGMAGEATDATLDELDRLYGPSHLPYTVQLHPTARPADLPDRLTKRGFETVRPWTILTRPPDAVPEGPRRGGDAPLRVARATEADADEVARILGQSFGVDVGERALFGATVGVEGWRHYLAYLADEAVGAAVLHVAGRSCLFGGSGTLAKHRRRGAQRALVDRRVRDALEAGCTELFLETQEDLGGEPPPPLRALVRAGFRPAFQLRSFGYRRGVRQRWDPATRDWH